MNQSDACVFCRITSGRIPCLKVFEDEASIAFLDIGPLAEGHLLVVPKAHHERLEDMPPEAVGRLMQPVPRLAKALLAVTGADAYNVLINVGRVAGQAVMHTHVHLIPRAGGDGLGYRWPAKTYAAGRGEQLAEQLIDAFRTS
jgi:histidine triad (HIT) family protein